MGRHTSESSGTSGEACGRVKAVFRRTLHTSCVARLHQCRNATPQQTATPHGLGARLHVTVLSECVARRVRASIVRTFDAVSATN